MGETYENRKRNQFRNELRVENHQSNRRRESYRQGQQNRRNTVARETYTTKKGSTSRASRAAQKRKEELKKKLGIVIATGLVAVGSLAALSRGDSKTISLEQAIQSGRSVESLGLNQGIVNKYKDILKRLEDENITNSELLKISTDINNLQFDVLKSKLSYALDVPEDNIRLNSADKDGNRESIVANGDRYETKNIILPQKNTMSSKIADSISDISEMQSYMQKLQHKDFDRESTIETYDGYLESIDKLAAADIKLYNGTDLKIEYTKVADLEKQEDQEQDGADR